jgi:hypothetical protein
MTRFWVGKAKRKKKPEPNLDFVSPYSPEDCISRLENFPGVGGWFPVKTRVELSQVDEKTWEFHIGKTHFSTYFLSIRSFQRDPLFVYFKLQLRGSLRSLPSETTLVLGKVNVSTSTYLINLLLLLVSALVVSLLIFAYPYSGQLVLLAMLLILGGLIPFLMTVLGLIPVNQDHYVDALQHDVAKVLGEKE